MDGGLWGWGWLRVNAGGRVRRAWEGIHVDAVDWKTIDVIRWVGVAGGDGGIAVGG